MALPSCRSIFIQCVPHRIDFSDSPSSRLQNHSIQYGNHFEIHSDIPSLSPIVTSVTSAFKAYRRISANRGQGQKVRHGPHRNPQKAMSLYKCSFEARRIIP
eukprot:g73893.t1